MPGLLSSLTLSANAVRANQTAVRTVGQNIANVNTPGYTRQRVEMQTVTPNRVGPGLIAGSGMRIEQIQRVYDQQLENNVAMAGSRYGHAQGRDAVVASAGELLGDLGQDNLRGRLDGFFDSVRELSADASDLSARRVVVTRAQDLAGHFRGLAREITQARRSTDGQLTVEAGRVNELAAEVAELNLRIHEAEIGGADANDLRDRRGMLVKDLAELTGAQASEDSKGFVNVRLPGGLPLVDGVRSGRMALVTGNVDPEVSGLQLTTPGGRAIDVTGAFGDSGGKIGGMLRARDQDLPGLMRQLDNLAFEVASRVNAIHTNGFDLNGDPGQEMFTLADPANAAGAASAIAVNDAIAADPALIAAAQEAGASGDNRNALALLALGGDGGGGTQSLGEMATALAGEAGSLQAQAGRAMALADATKVQAENMRERLSGVSIDEEMIELVKFEKAFDASARVLSTVNELLDAVINLR